MCNSGVGLTPTIQGTTHHFSAGGLYNGLVLMIDDETQTYWDHITGEAVHGPLTGAAMETWPLRYVTAATALAADPELQVARPPKGSPRARLMAGMHARKIGKKGFLPPPFRLTMGEADDRLPRMEQGLGVVVDGDARFFPSRSLAHGATARFGDRVVDVRLSADRVPEATWADGTRPMQLFTRWYGFSYTYPCCEIVSD